MSPRKCTAVLATVAGGLWAKVATKAATNSLSLAVKAAIIDFYNDDSVSRMMSGTADYVTIWHEDGSKERRQKRHLMMTVGEAYKEFQRENPLSQVGKSIFASLRPEHMLHMCASTTTTCF